ncbi:MAG: hypothetical protein Q8M03_10830 [Legionella sp.]|nr:hypothetical protein [Legionella sp.]
MADELIPPDVREFILTYIDSIAQLEALILLANQPEERWTVTGVAAQLYIGESQAKAVLERLCDNGLLDCGDGVLWFNGDPAGQREIVEKLSTHYARHLIPVTNLVHAKPSGARAFAAAFKLRKDR